jgi:hypothetical protein
MGDGPDGDANRDGDLGWEEKESAVDGHAAHAADRRLDGVLGAPGRMLVGANGQLLSTQSFVDQTRFGIKALQKILSGEW